MMRACFLLHDLLGDAAQAYPDAAALTCGDAAVSYASLARRCDALAGALAAAGVERGDRVVIFADNGIAAVVAFWAVLKANAVAVVVHPQTKPAKLAYLLHDSRARARPSRRRAAAAPLHRHRSRRHHLYLGIHRRAQGRDADPPQHARRRGVDLGVPRDPERRGDPVRAPLSFDYGLYQMIMAVARYLHAPPIVFGEPLGDGGAV